MARTHTEKLAEVVRAREIAQAQARIAQSRSAGPPLRYGHGYRPAEVSPKPQPKPQAQPARSRSVIPAEKTVMVAACLLNGKTVEIYDPSKWQSDNSKGLSPKSICCKIWTLLEETPGLDVTELSAKLGLASKSTAWAVQSLFRRGLIGRVGDRLPYEYHTVFAPKVLPYSNRRGPRK